MPIGLTDRLVALGTFPLLEDIYLLGGLRTVADSAERDAIDATSRKAGMFVWVEADLTLFRLDADLTTWVEFSGGSGSGTFDYVLDPNQMADEGNVYVYLNSVVAAASTVQGRVRVEVVPGSIEVSSETFDLSNLSFHSRTGEPITITFQGTALLTGLPYELENIHLVQNKASAALCTLAAPAKMDLKGDSQVSLATSQPFVDQNGFDLDVTLSAQSRVEGLGASGAITTSTPATLRLFFQTIDTTQTTPIADSVDLDVVVFIAAAPPNVNIYFNNTLFPTRASLVFIAQSNLYTVDAAPSSSSEAIELVTGAGGLGGGASGGITLFTGTGGNGDGGDSGPSGAINITTSASGVRDGGTNAIAAGNINITTGGGSDGGVSAPGGDGGTVQINTGVGGDDGGVHSGSGGPFLLNTGDGGAGIAGGNGGGGGYFELVAGDGGNGDNLGGNGGSFSLLTGSGGSGTIDAGGAGGELDLTTGVGGSSSTTGVQGGAGGNLTIVLGEGGGSTDGPGGFGGEFSLTTGTGGDAANTTDEGGRGGHLTLTLGPGGDGGGNGGGLFLTTGSGGVANDSVGGGDGGDIVLGASGGGAGSATAIGGNGGPVQIFSGSGGPDGGSGAGNGGEILLQGGEGGLASGSSTGSGGVIRILAGQGGEGDGTTPSGPGGSIVLTPGSPGVDGGSGVGLQGVVLIRPTLAPTELRFEDLDENYVGFRAPNTVTNTTYVLPAADGDPDQALTTNGSGVLSWQTPGGGSSGEFTQETSTNDTDPHNIYVYTDPLVEDRGCITIEAMVQAIGKFGVYASFKFVATFVRSGTGITEADVTFLNGPVRSNPAFDVLFAIDDENIELQVVSATTDEVNWKATGVVIHVDGTFPGEA
jgi:hypothetical protein